MGDIFQAQRRAILIAEDQVAVLGCGAQLVVGVDGHRMIFTVKAAFGAIDVAVTNQRIYRLQRQMMRRQRLRIHLHPNRRLVAARQRHHPDAGDLRQLQCHPGVDQILHRGQRQRAGARRQRHHRAVRRIDLFVGRRIGQVVGQQVIRRIDRRLHLLFGDIQRQIEAELQGNDRRAAGAGGAHLAQPRHLP